MLEEALAKELGNSSNKDNLLLQALACLVLYSFRNKGKKDKVQEPDYSLQDAFNDAFKRRGVSEPMKIRLMPSPS